MKHAILILAHKNIGQLCRLVEYFKHDCDVFIHIDKKQTIKPADKEKILGFEQVKFISLEYDVNWGGTSVLESEMHLLRLSVQHSDANYFHLISGQDYPTRAHALYMLTQIQQKIKSPRGDASTRSHFQNLNDQISRALVIN